MGPINYLSSDSERAAYINASPQARRLGGLSDYHLRIVAPLYRDPRLDPRLDPLDSRLHSKPGQNTPANAHEGDADAAFVLGQDRRDQLDLEGRQGRGTAGSARESAGLDDSSAHAGAGWDDEILASGAPSAPVSLCLLSVVVEFVRSEGGPDGRDSCAAGAGAKRARVAGVTRTRVGIGLALDWASGRVAVVSHLTSPLFLS